MNHKRSILVVGLLLLATMLVLWLLLDREDSPDDVSTQKNTEREATVASTTASIPREESNEAASKQSVDQKVLERREEERRKDLVDKVITALNTPISFYGRVIDQYGEPVADAEVGYLASDRPQGTSYWGESDAQGYFSITGIKGYNLSVKVNKEGYHYIEEKSNGLFAYASGADGVVFKAPPTKDNPAVFILHKMGETEPLIYGGTRYYKLSKDGQPIEIDLVAGKESPIGSGGIRFARWVNEQSKTTSGDFDWKFQIIVPGGGIIQREGEFDFEAPENGYQEMIEINMPVSLGDKWQYTVTGSYFVRSRDNRYARINLTIQAGHNNTPIALDAFVNPNTGNRNLEFDPKKEIKPPR